MPRAKYLSVLIKRKRTPLIILRDYPKGAIHKCCYCKVKFDENVPKRRVNWEHLDDNNANQNLWNLAWSCVECNQRKRNNYDLKILGMELIQINKEFESIEAPGLTSVCETSELKQQQKTSEIDLSPVMFEIAHNFLIEKLNSLNKRMTTKLAANTIAARCIKRIGQGSPITARRNLDILSTEEFIYKIDKIEGQFYILIDVTKNNINQQKLTENKIMENLDK